MALSKIWNNTTFSIPQAGEKGWSSLTNFLAAIADNAQTTGAQKIGRRVAIASPVTVAATTDCYVGVNIGAPSVVNLPAGTNGAYFVIADESGLAATYAITINPSGANTINGASSYAITAGKGAVGLVFSGGDWKILHIYYSSGFTAKDSEFILQNSSNLTKKAKFDVSGIPTGTLRTYTFPSSEGTFLLTTVSQTIQNKILDSTNTATGIRIASLTPDGIATVTFPTVSGTVTLNAASQLLQNKTFDSSDVLNGARLSSFTSNGSDTITVPSGTDTLANLSGAQTFSNKTYTAPTITNGTATGTTLTNTSVSDRLTFTNSTVPTTPSSGKSALYVNSSDKALHIVSDVGSDTRLTSSPIVNYLEAWNTFSLSPVGGASNLTATGNRTSNQTLWGVFTATSGNLSQNTGSVLRGAYSLQYSNGSSTSSFVESPMFQLAPIDVRNPMLFISFDMQCTSATAGDWKLQIIRYNSSGTYQETITPSVTSLPAGYSSVKCAFSHSSTASDYYSVRFQSGTASASTLYISNIIVGPQLQLSADTIGPWVTMSPTPSFTNFGTVTNIDFRQRRVGDTMEIMGSFNAGTLAVAVASVSVLSGSTITIDSTKVKNTTTTQEGYIVGTYQSGNANSGGHVIVCTGTSTTNIYFTDKFVNSPNLDAANASVITGNNAGFALRCSIPIAQWNATTTLAGSASIEYASNSSTSDANDTTSFVYGAQGSSLPGTLTATRTKRIRWQYPVQPTDRFAIELRDTATTLAFRPLSSYDASLSVTPLDIQSTTLYGIGFGATQSTTDMDITFGTYANKSGLTYASAGTNWGSISTNARWRVAKYSAVGLAELAPATYLSQGTITRQVDWTSFTPSVIGGFGVTTNINCWWKVLGNSMFMRGSFTTGTVVASLASVQIPSNVTFTIDSAKLINNTTANPGSVLGTASCSGLANSDVFVVAAPATSAFTVYFGGLPTGTTPLTPANGSTIAASTSVYSFFLEIPII